jgi:ATP-dependent DNA helicase DinG
MRAVIERATPVESELPWRAASPASGGVVFVAIEASGHDTTIDAVTRVHALLRAGDATGWEELDRVCAGGNESENARLARAAFVELAARAAGALVVAADAAALAAWTRHFGSGCEALQDALGVDEIASVLCPARARAVASIARMDARRARCEVEASVAAFLELAPGDLELALAALVQAWRALRDSDPDRARRAGAALWLADMPARWAEGGLRAAGEGALGGSFAHAAEDAGDVARERMESSIPRCAAEAALRDCGDTVPLARDDCAPLDKRDLAAIDAVFETHLPAALGEHGSYREGQHAVAREVAATLGAGRLLLVHAPTGTGKTLAYLVPAILWSERRGVRVAVSTYTRALQEQAIARDVPLAFDALARAGVAASARVVALKGRDNYLCWRALRNHAPSDDEDGAAWLAWTTLVLFGLTDPDGDLDRLPRPRAPAPRFQRELDLLLDGVRGAASCCKARDDRAACAAEIARQRAERSHVVIVNHALALALPDGFRHAIFDECEHLHDQAHGAWSRAVSLRCLRESLARLSDADRGASRALIARVQRLAIEGRELSRAAIEAQASCERAGAALADLERALGAFIAWRDRRERDAQDGEPARLAEFAGAAADPLAEDAVAGDARALLAARAELEAAGIELDRRLAEIATGVDRLRARTGPRLRRSLEHARGEVAEWLEALRAWIPLEGGAPRFSGDVFRDVEEGARGDRTLVARVLLPNELLGRRFHPALASGVFVSATTYLRGSFDGALGYLGLDRAARPAPDEARAPCEVRTFRAGDPFDYSRVLVCVPSDAPAYAAASAQFREYVRRFLGFLGERTRGRVLALFTNADEVQRAGAELSGFFRARGIPLFFQNMPGLKKEEVAALFRARTDAVLLGVDTFWYGADFPGESLEYLVIVKLPYGVPDRYHRAQCAALGADEQRRRIYLPRALAKFRQGFGRLMRRETDRGCVFVLDTRVLRGAHRLFLRELPLEATAGDASSARRARFASDTTERCVAAALEHMGVADAARERGLDVDRF